MRLTHEDMGRAVAKLADGTTLKRLGALDSLLICSHGNFLDFWDAVLREASRGGDEFNFDNVIQEHTRKKAKWDYNIKQKKELRGHRSTTHAICVAL